MPRVEEVLQPYCKNREVFHCAGDTGYSELEGTPYLLPARPTAERLADAAVLRHGPASTGAELGGTTSVFPSDEGTRRFLEAQDRGGSWRALAADEGAAYERVIAIDLSALEPLAACPHSPGNIATIASLAGKTVSQVLIGSCTNASYRDLKTVALLLRGKHVHPEVSVGVAPGSRQVVQMLAREGLLEPIISAGVRLFENVFNGGRQVVLGLIVQRESRRAGKHKGDDQAWSTVLRR